MSASFSEAAARGIRHAANDGLSGGMLIAPVRSFQHGENGAWLANGIDYAGRASGAGRGGRSGERRLA